MDRFLDLLACPACAGRLDASLLCAACGKRYPIADGIPNLRLDTDACTEIVRRFYERAPFPGYPPRDSLAWLRARAERGEFPRLLDQAIPGDARILDVGCGTGQMSLYLSRADRTVVAMDLARESLALGAAAARRFEIDRVLFVESDLQRPGLRDGAFDVVYSSGVLHHTPDPRASFARCARLVRPGGMVVLGVYNRIARLPLRLRRAVARITRFRWIPFDPVLRDRSEEPARREAWLRDQYDHPEEHRHSLGEVRRWFAANGFDYVRAYPHATLGGSGEPSQGLFDPAPDDWRLEGWLAQWAWMRELGHEGGLFVTIGRRRDPAR